MGFTAKQAVIIIISVLVLAPFSGVCAEELSYTLNKSRPDFSDQLERFDKATYSLLVVSYYSKNENEGLVSYSSGRGFVYQDRSGNLRLVTAGHVVTMDKQIVRPEQQPDGRFRAQKYRLEETKIYIFSSDKWLDFRNIRFRAAIKFFRRKYPLTTTKKIYLDFFSPERPAVKAALKLDGNDINIDKKLDLAYKVLPRAHVGSARFISYDDIYRDSRIRAMQDILVIGCPLGIGNFTRSGEIMNSSYYCANDNKTDPSDPIWITDCNRAVISTKIYQGDSGSPVLANTKQDRLKIIGLVVQTYSGMNYGIIVKIGPYLKNLK